MNTDYGEIFRSVRIGGIIKWHNRLCVVTKKETYLIRTYTLTRKSGVYEVLCFYMGEFVSPSEAEYLGVL